MNFHQMSGQSTCIKHADNLEQTCYYHKPNHELRRHPDISLMNAKHQVAADVRAAACAFLTEK